MNTEDDLKMPMDGMDDATPPNEEVQQPQETQEQRDQRERDERGRFKPGEPDNGAAARRERQERDQYKREAEEAKNAYATLQKRLDDAMASINGDDPNEVKQPEDPLAPVKEQLGKINERFETQDRQQQEQEQHRQMIAYADQDEAVFREKTPDFPNATQHYIQSRVNEMTALGVSQDQIEQVLQQEAMTLLQQCQQAGRSPAETLYNMAKARGYAGNSLPMTPSAPQNFGGRSLGNGQGAGARGVTATDLANMSDEEYFAWRNTPEARSAIKRMQGGM